MALRVCEDCTAAYPPDVPLCPHCGSERGRVQGSDPYRGGDVPKISRNGGASIAGEHAEAAEETEVPSSPGSSSETSPKRPASTQKTSARDRQKRAPKTASRSKQDQTEGSTARSTAGDGQKTPSSDGSEGADL